MSVVTIARQLGSGGEEIAAAVAARLEAPLWDHELLVQASEQTGIPLHYLEDLDERGRSAWRRPIDLVRLIPLPPINPEVPDVLGDRYPPTGPLVARGSGLVSPAYWAAEAYAALLARTMRALAASGAAVLVGRAGNEALAGMPGVLHVLVVGSLRRRIERVMAAEGLDPFDALDRVKESDRNRAAYVRQFFGADWLSPLRYDLVVNTDQVELEAAADLVAQAARARATPAATPQAVPAA